MNIGEPQRGFLWSWLLIRSNISRKKKETVENIEQKHQANQYEFPYHYIASFTENGYSQTKTWTWGLRYLGGIYLVLNNLREHEFESLCDIGCGDGFFLRHVAEKFRKKNLMGIDYDKRAISLAKALNPRINFENIDIGKDVIEDNYDILTMIEVLEHIKLDEVDNFLEKSSRLINSGGYLLLTVPHKNEVLSDKHFQHFDSENLFQILGRHFSKVVLFPFDGVNKTNYKARLLSIILNIVCDSEKIIINHPSVLSLRWKLYVDNFLYNINEDRCRRLFAKCSV